MPLSAPRAGFVLLGCCLWLPAQVDLSKLPSSHSVAGILQQQEAEAIPWPPDFGGLASHRLAIISFQAASWTATAYELNRLDAADPYQPGRPMFLVDPDAIETITVHTGPQPARLHGPGATVELWTRHAAPRWHGTLASHFTGNAMASGKLPEKAASAGLLRPEAFRWYSRDHVRLGGPAGKRADIFASATAQWASQSWPREADSPLQKSRLLLGSAKARFRPADGNSVEAAYVGSRMGLSGYGIPSGLEALTGRRGAPPFRLSGGLPEKNHLGSAHLGWVREQAGSTSDIRYGYGFAHLETPAPAATGPARVELLDGSVEGPPLLASLGRRARHHLAGEWRRKPFSFFGADHKFGAGGSVRAAEARNTFLVPGNQHLLVAAGVPASLVRFNTPVTSKGRVSSYSAHASDSMTLTGWLSVDVGVFAEHTRGNLPPHSGSPRAVNRTPIVWSNLAPRVAVAVAPPLRFAPVLRASYGRYYYPLAVRHLDFANADSLSGEEFRWEDHNGDAQWQPSETGQLLRRFGGLYSSIASPLRRPYIDAFTAGLEASFAPVMRAGLRLFRRDEKHRLAAVNTGIVSRPLALREPGPDYQPGTYDDQTLLVYEQDPATWGQDQFLLTNAGLRSFSAGLVAELNGRGDRFWWRLSFVAEKGHGPTNSGNDPWENDTGVVGSLLQDENTLFNATGRTYFDRAYVAKLAGYWHAPRNLGGFEAGAVVSYWDGLPFGRRLLVRGLSQGPQVLSATPRGSPEGGHRTEFQLTLDLRVSRSFQLPVGTLRALADIFNLSNASYNLVERDWSSTDFSRRLPVAIQPPRFVRVGLEYSF